MSQMNLQGSEVSSQQKHYQFIITVTLCELMSANLLSIRFI